MDNYSILKSHIEFKKISVHSKEKLQDISRYIKKFIDYVNKPLSKVSEEDLVKFLSSLSSKYSIGSINDIKIYLKVFIKWHFVDWSSRFRNLDQICKQQSTFSSYQPEDMLSFEEVEKLVQGENDLMYKVYWLLFFYGGFRPSEACRLQWDQVYFEPEGVIIKIRTSKTNKDFYKSFPSNVDHFLKEWRQYNHSKFLFPSPVSSGDVIRARSVCGRLKRLSKRVLHKEVVPYALRHSIATILYNDDSKKDDDSANQLGHTKNMKNRYTHLDAGKIKARARSLWIKVPPLTSDERREFTKLKDEVSQLKKHIEYHEKLLFKLRPTIIKLKGKTLSK